MESPAILSPAHRALCLDHAVHRGAPGESGFGCPESVALCLYRDPKTFEVHTLELSPITGALVRELERSSEPLVRVIAAVAERHGAVVDQVFLTALSQVLADFLERGLLLGSRRSERAVGTGAAGPTS